MSNPPYAIPLGQEEGEPLSAEELVSSPEETGDTVTADIYQLYDWEVEEGHDHCSGCQERAAGGPYTSDFPYRPRDGTTPCGPNCYCSFNPRAPTWLGTEQVHINAMGNAVLNSVAAQWR